MKLIHVFFHQEISIKFKSISKKEFKNFKMSNIFFKVLRSGINTTYQDEGRFGLQHFGVPPSGCMDHKSFLVANALVGNKKKLWSY